MSNRNLSPSKKIGIIICVVAIISLLTLAFLLTKSNSTNSDSTVSNNSTSSINSQSITSAITSQEVSGQQTSADLIIGKIDKGNNYEISACLRSTSGIIHLSDSSTWFSYEPNDLKPNPKLVDPGKFSNNSNFDQIAWAGVGDNVWGLDTIFAGNRIRPTVDSLISESTPELLGKFSFDKNSPNSKADSINLKKTKYYTTEGDIRPVDINIIKIDKDCTEKSN